MGDRTYFRTHAGLLEWPITVNSGNQCRAANGVRTQQAGQRREGRVDARRVDPAIAEQQPARTGTPTWNAEMPYRPMSCARAARTSAASSAASGGPPGECRRSARSRRTTARVRRADARSASCGAHRSFCTRFRCRAKSPSSMKRASAACVSVQVCQSTICFALVSAPRARRNRVADPQLRKDRLRKRADIRDEARAVEALQRFHRPALEAELAVVVVLDDHRAAALRPSSSATRRSSVIGIPSGN